MVNPSNIVTLHGNPLTLSGNLIQNGDRLPNAELINNDLKAVRLSDYRGKVVIISSVPSLDTPVCDMQTRRFNNEAASLSDAVVILTLSMDLPFAQKRWCGAAGVERVITLSDHRTAAFGQAAGLLINDLRLLARAVLVVDREGVVRHSQLVQEVSEEPDYDAVLGALKTLI
ncbi:MAG: thiol peroxidase [Desulfatitalea sp.]|nr:thiol peroxidase [Desulfatitalea sp.]NNK01638.1 thiol peroxidase [Desulfatitalea sp.]